MIFTTGDLVRLRTECNETTPTDMLEQIKGQLGVVVGWADKYFDREDRLRLLVHFDGCPTEWDDRCWHCMPEDLDLVYRAEDPT